MSWIPATTNSAISLLGVYIAEVGGWADMFTGQERRVIPKSVHRVEEKGRTFGAS